MPLSSLASFSSISSSSSSEMKSIFFLHKHPKFGTWWFLDWELWGLINWELLGFISNFQPIDRCSATIDSRPLGTRSSQNLPSKGGSCVPALQYLLTISIFTADWNFRRSLFKNILQKVNFVLHSFDTACGYFCSSQFIYMLVISTAPESKHILAFTD